MRNPKQFFSDIIRKPPVLFPLVGLFHILWLAWLIWDDRGEPFPDIVWLQVLWMVLLTFFWFAASDMRRWGAIGYILLTLLDSGLYLAVRRHKLLEGYESNLVLMDGIFSAFLLYFYKKYR